MNEPRTYYLALDLKDDAEAIAAYERHHREDRFWPEIGDSIREAGVRDMEIYRTGNPPVHGDDGVSVVLVREESGPRCR